MAEIAKLVPRLRHTVKPLHRRLRNPEGPLGRIGKLRTVLTDLFKKERVENLLPYCDEVRGYAERLISEAIRHGDSHKPTMEMADFWLEDKTVVHKLFKVLVPRYKDTQKSYTDLHWLPHDCKKAYTEKSASFSQRCVLELRYNPYPPMPSKPKPNSQSLTNILLREASKEFRKTKPKEDK